MVRLNSLKLIRVLWQGSDDKGTVEFAGDSHYQPGIAGVQFLVDARFDRFNAYPHQSSE
jgi:hypothetical protein